ncbi:MAG: mechanosensitive ion channel family protein [Candidatus Bathyarchaeota archaeon]|nr:mechanosensitive ion channel family protein [Candidatus Bathyarchaeota archaeon]
MADLIDPELIVQIVQAVIIFVVAFVLVKFINRLILRTADAKTADKKRVIENMQRFFQFIIYAVAVVLILWAFNVDVTGLIAGLGVSALVIGFALKEVIENWVSGFLILSGKTFKIGDVIQVGDLKGVVTELSLRTTTLKTYDRNEIIIPNSTLLKERIINLTGGGQETVASITFAIDYIYNVEQAKNAIREALLQHKSVIVNEERRREIRFLVRTKEWATEIEALFWIDHAENEEFIKSEITQLANKKLAQQKILPPIPGAIRKEYMEPKEKP